MDEAEKKDVYIDFYERAYDDGHRKGQEDAIYQLREYIVESLCPLAIKYFDEAVEKLKGEE